MSEEMDVKSCDPQLLDTDKPTSEWSIDMLCDYAQQKHNTIEKAERPLAGQYWLLGLSLTLAREKLFKHGKWGKQLKLLKINKTRASKAIAIYKTHSSEVEVAEMSVTEAYAKRERKKKPPTPEPAPLSEKAAFRQFLHGIDAEAGKYVDVAAFLEPAEASEFAIDVEKTIEKMNAILERLRKTVSDNAADQAN